MVGFSNLHTPIGSTTPLLSRSMSTVRASLPTSRSALLAYWPIAGCVNITSVKSGASTSRPLAVSSTAGPQRTISSWISGADITSRRFMDSLLEFALFGGALARWAVVVAPLAERAAFIRYVVAFGAGRRNVAWPASFFVVVEFFLSLLMLIVRDASWSAHLVNSSIKIVPVVLVKLLVVLWPPFRGPLRFL